MRPLIFRRRRFYLVSLALAAVIVFSAGLAQSRLLEDLRNFVFDSFQRIAPRQYDPAAPVRIVSIDEDSLAAYGQWPWPRTRLAELTTKLAELGATAIAYDFVFAEPDRMSLENILPSIPDETIRRELARKTQDGVTNDQVFAQSIAAAPSVLGTTLAASGGSSLPRKAGYVTAGDDPIPFLSAFPAIVAPIKTLADAAKGIGATNWLPDHDQVVRRILLFGVGPSGLTPSLVLEALRVAQGETSYVIRSSNASGETAFGEHTGVNAVKVGAVEIDTGAKGDIRPRYTYSTPDRVISARDVLENRVKPGELKGKVVFVGAYAVGLGDILATPLNASVPGVEVHAQILESLLSHKLLSRPDWATGFELVMAVATFAAVSVLLLFVPPYLAAVAAGIIVASLFLVSFFLFDWESILIDPAFPSLTTAIAFGVGTLTLWSFDRVAKRNIQQAFGKFVVPAVVDQLVEHPERLVLGGETRELTVLFSDLRDFAGLSEGLTARELTNFMNEYLTPMTDAILEHEGTLDKYVGDAIVAFWNAPLDVLAHPSKAVSAALQMRTALTEFNAMRAAKAQAAGVAFRLTEMGIGLNLGPCNVGNMGSIRRFDYSILGDTVNVASRLEGVCKTFGIDLIASAAVQEAAPEFAWLSLDTVIVKGRKTPTAIYTVAGDAAFAFDPAFLEWKKMHDAMLRTYEARDFANALQCAEQLAAKVGPPWRALYASLGSRCTTLAKMSPGVRRSRGADRA